MANYKGRSSISELEHMPMRLFHGLYSRILIRLSTEEGKLAAAGEELQEQVEEGM